MQLLWKGHMTPKEVTTHKLRITCPKNSTYFQSWSFRGTQTIIMAIKDMEFWGNVLDPIIHLCGEFWRNPINRVWYKPSDYTMRLCSLFNQWYPIPHLLLNHVLTGTTFYSIFDIQDVLFCIPQLLFTFEDTIHVTRQSLGRSYLRI